MKTVTKNCKQCGIQFTKRDNGNPHTFCSRKCGGEWHLENRVMRGPSLIGNTFRKGLRPTNAFTSEQVRGENNPKWKEGALLTCEYCKKEFKRKDWLLKRCKVIRFCSRKCFEESGVFVGEKSPAWVGGVTTYRGRGWNKARKSAIDRDKGACVLCKAFIGDSIAVHHIRPYRDFDSSSRANVLENLVCLCQPCHARHERMRPSKFLGILLRIQYQSELEDACS